MSNVTRRFDIFNLVSDIQPRTGNLLETVAKDKRDRLASGFFYDVKNLRVIEQSDLEALGRDSKAIKCIAVSSSNPNSIAFSGNSEILYVDGYRIVMESDPSKFNNTLVDLLPNPENGSQLDYIFMEVWKEYVDLDSEGSVLFPYGNTQYKSDANYDECELSNANRSGNGSPAYLIDSDKHGYYVSVKDNNIDKFMMNPNNNIGIDDNFKVFQIRYRIRVVNVNDVNMIHAYEDNAIKAQGKLANPSAISFNNVTSDTGLSIANNVAISDDAKVRAIPLAMVCKRNTSEFSIKNMNGSVNRPDYKIINIERDDVIDLRLHIIPNDSYDFERMSNINQDLMFKAELDTVAEPLMMDPAGIESYTDTGIRNKMLLRADMAIGNIAALEGDWQVIAKSKADNKVNSKFDGLRSIYNNIPTTQDITFFIQSMNSSTTRPNNSAVFNYDNNTKMIVVDSRGLLSGSNYNQDNEYVTKLSGATPSITMHNPISTLGFEDVVPNLEWSGLDTERAICNFIDESHITIYTSTDVSNVAIDDIYTSANNVTCKVSGIRQVIDEEVPANNINMVSFTFEGSVIPKLGIFTFVEGEGTAGNLTADCGPANNVILIHAQGDVSGIKINDVYNNNGVDFDVKSMDYNNNIIGMSSVNVNQPLPSSSAWAKVTSTEGPNSFSSDGLFGDIKKKIVDGVVTNDNKVSCNLYPSNTPMTVTFTVKFAKGNGILSRIPFKDNRSFRGTLYYVDNEQILSNNGIDWIPFDVDGHCKKTNLTSFLYRQPVLKDVKNPCALRDSDGSIKLYYEVVDEGASRIMQSVSMDGIHFAPGVVVMNVGTSLDGYNDLNNFNPCVIKDGAVYKMWFTGEGNDNVLRVLYSTSSDGLTWTAPVKVLDFTNIRLATSGNTKCHSVINDGATSYKMWFTDGSNHVYMVTSSDGITWNFARNTNKVASNVSVFKESSIYRMFTLESAVPYMSISSNGFTFSKSVRLPNSNTKSTLYEPIDEHDDCMTVTVNNDGITVIKDRKSYKMFVSTNRGIMAVVLACTDILNTDSTTGLYSTIGDINVAPPANSKVVFLYESRADQTDRRLFNVDETIIEGIHKASWSIVTSLDSFTNINEDIIYRDAVLNVYPNYGIGFAVTPTSNAVDNNAGASVNTNNTVEVSNNHNADGMISHILKPVECTDGYIYDSYVANINDDTINNGVLVNCQPLVDTNLYHTAPLDKVFMEMTSEIMSINGMLYNVIGGNCNSENYYFDLTMKPTRMIGNPIVKVITD